MDLLEQGAALETKALKKQEHFCQRFCLWVAVLVLPSLGVLSSTTAKHLLLWIEMQRGKSLGSTKIIWKFKTRTVTPHRSESTG